MQLIYKKLTELKPYEKNPRKNDEAVQYVAESIKQFGFKVPLVIDSDGVIICGHTRYKASQQLNLKEVPCIIADDLTEEQIKAFRLADNKVAEIAEWDDELLALELDDICTFDMSEFSFIQEEEIETVELEIEKDSNDGERVLENKLKWGKREVPLTDEEIELLEQRLLEYVEEVGTSYGFIMRVLS